MRPIAVLAVFALVMTASVPLFFRTAKQQNNFLESGHLADTAYWATQVLYWESEGLGTDPVDLFFPGLSESPAPAPEKGGVETTANHSPPDDAPDEPAADDGPADSDGDAFIGEVIDTETSGEGTDSADAEHEQPVAPDVTEHEPISNAYEPNESATGTGRAPVDAETLTRWRTDILSVMNESRANFYDTWGGLTHAFIGHGDDSRGIGDAAVLRDLEKGNFDGVENSLYWVVIEFDSRGNISTPDIYGAPADSLLYHFRSTGPYDYWRQMLQRYMPSEEVEQLVRYYSPLRDVTVVLSIPAHMSARDNSLAAQMSYFSYGHFRSGGFNSLYMLLVAAAATLAFFTGRPILEKTHIGRYLYLEVVLSLTVVILSLYDWLADIGLRTMTFSSDFSLSISFFGDIPGALTGLLFFFIVAFLLFLAAYICALFLADIRGQKLRTYIYDHLLTLSLLRWFYKWVGKIDLTAPGGMAVIKILLINFAVLAVICLFNPLSLIGLGIYSVVLYFTLRRFLRDISGSYKAVLDLTGEMAEGHLGTEIPDDLGIFDQLGTALGKIQGGFREAVEAETRSQKMRSELITNVSHDLKTPLTGIITYVNLLKEAGLSEEEQAKYIATLDLKSRRLGVLIEDLFEISKVTSGNVKLNRADINLPSLVRQVVTECGDELTAAGIELRLHFPEEKVILNLDGAKTARIFQNLIINVAKYGMAGTRAYIDLAVTEGRVVAVVKNVSRDALDFDPAYIAERFVRGDASRGTEGSGLGLAIAKSFAELQGGDLAIGFDGDLFKATVSFPLLIDSPAENP